MGLVYLYMYTPSLPTNLSYKVNQSSVGNYLVVEPTHLNNMLVKLYWTISPGGGENKKYLNCHHLGIYIYYIGGIPSPLTVESEGLQGTLHRNEQIVISLLVGG